MEPSPHRHFLPLINRGTFCRVYSINQTVLSIISSLPKDKNINILLLGSGFDTMYFTLSSQNISNITFFEFDYDKIIKTKQQIIHKSKLLSQFSSSNYHLFSCDITDTSKMKKQLESSPSFSNIKDDLTIVICECLLVYIDKDFTIDILSTLYKLFPNMVILEYDLTGANDGFGREMVDNLKVRGIELRGFRDVPTLKEQIERMREVGMTQVEMIDMLEVYYKLIPQEERKRIDGLEMMDEFEEFDLLQKHACFGYGISLKNESDFKHIKDVLKFSWKK